ncbi:Transposase, Mutator family, partial [Alicyclobacillus vulcanalis]
GLSGVDIVVSDSHSGLVKALQTEFQGCTWQRRQTHFMRNLLDAVNSGLKLPKKKSRSIPQKQRIRFPKIIAIRSPHIRSLRLLSPRMRA